MQTGSHHPRSWSQRPAWVFAASALALTLALGGCATPHARNGGSPTFQQTQGGSSATGTSAGSSTGATTGSSNSSVQQLQNIDNQNQSDSQQLNSAQNDSGVNYSSQENQTQP
jgi:hypothetical protein